MKFSINRQRLEVAYSLFLIILIPSLIVAGTLWLTTQVKNDFDQELRRKANLANEVFGVSAANILATSSPSLAPKLLQRLIDQVRSQAPEVDQLGLVQPANGSFKSLASSDPTKVGAQDSTIQTQLTWSNNQPVASLIAAGEGASREWLVETPVPGSSGQITAIAVMRVSLNSSDQLIGSTLRNSFIGLGIMLTIIIFLLLNHFRLVQYAELFRKQKELAQMKDDFISIATHELKAPMSVIRGYISMALEEKPAKSVSDMLTIAFDQTERLGRLVTDLLDVSRLEQGKTKYNLSPLKLSETLMPLVNTYQPKAKSKGLKLVYEPPVDIPPVLADPDRVSEIFTNLIDNAIKYSRTGTVWVRHEVSPGLLITTVEDTGIGLTPEESSHLFARFYRAKNDDTRDISGTGLGLWIIKQYIEHMNGTIVVESKKGKGSKFIVTLPLA